MGKSLMALLFLFAAFAHPSFAAEPNSFGLDLYSKLKTQKGNLFYSPYSIEAALSMAYAGARGETAAQMKQFSQFTIPPEGVVVANSLWGQKGYSLKKEFLSILKTKYRSEFKQLDFIKETEKSRKEINLWVEQKTNDKIKELLKPGAVNSATRLILTNAIYFKADWAYQFEKEDTKPDKFYGQKNGSKTVPFMYQQKRYGYFENGVMQMVELPYKGHKLSSVFILPKAKDGLEKTEKELGALNKWTASLKHERVNLYLPKFKITSEFGLKDALYSMGIKDAFSLPPADFSGITGQKDLFISDVVHKAYVSVDEQGTEAAAATATTMATTAFDPTKPKLFKANHPFVFLIKENTSGTILFMGRVADPQ